MKETKAAKILSVSLYALLFAAAFLICAQIFPYGDDFFYGIFTKEGFSRFIERHIEHYQLANGRVIVHLLATFFLGQNLWLWRIVNTLSLVLCAALILRIAQPAPHDRPLCLALVSAVFLTLSPQITRQSIYWLTGSFNYLYPMLILLAYWRVLQRGLQTPSKLRWLPVFAFFAAATTEQGGLMCIGVTLLLLLDEALLQKKRIRPAHGIALLTAAAGLLTVLLAPGVANRVEMTDSPASGGLFSLIFYNLRAQGEVLFFDPYVRIVHMGMLSLAVFFLFRHAQNTPQGRARIIRLCGAVFGAAALLCYCCVPADLQQASRLTAAVALTGYLTALFWSAIAMLRQTRDSTPLIILILAFGSQLAMTVSPVAGPRTMTSFLFMAALFLAKAGALTAGSGSAGVFGTVFCTLLGQPYLAALTLPSVCTTAAGKSRMIRYLAILPILLTSLLCWRDTYTHTAQNAQVYRENIAAIHAYSGTGTLIQKKLPFDGYAWAMPYHNAYYDPYYNLFFDLPMDTDIQWIP